MTLDDAAVVVRKPDGKIKVKQAVHLVDAGMVGGEFWGMLIGLFFWMPWLGLAIGAITGAITGALSDYGINDKFIHLADMGLRNGNFDWSIYIGNQLMGKTIGVVGIGT